MLQSASVDRALELLNATAPEPPEGVGRLSSPAELVVWLALDTLPEEEARKLRSSPAAAASLFLEAGRLREAAVSALEAFRTRNAPPPDSLYAIDRVLRARTLRERLVDGPHGPLLREEEEGSDLLSLLAPLAHGFAELLTGADPGRLRRCPAPRCGAWFLDTSKGGRRKWCSMATCGNRAKAARHRDRQRARGAPTG